MAALHAKNDGPLYYYGPTVENFWNDRGSDFTGAEYWVAFPAELAGQDVRVPPLASSPELPLARYGHPVGQGAEHKVDKAGDAFVQLKANRGDATVAVRRMVWAPSGTPSLVAVRLRTNGIATLQAAATSYDAPFAEIRLPDTKMAWRTVWLDLDEARANGGRVGDHILYLRSVGGTANVDVIGVTPQAHEVVAPVRFADAPQLSLVAVAGEELSRTFAWTGSDTATLALQGASQGMSLTGNDFRWTPKRAGTHDVLVVASDATTDTTLPVTVTVAPDRPAAIAALLAGVDEPATYTSGSWAAVAAARDAAAAASTADSTTFAGLLESLRAAVAALEELSPRLADGSLDYTGLVTSPLTTAQMNSLVDDDNQTFWGDQRVPNITFDAGPGHRLRADRFGYLARDTFPNRAKGTNVYGSDDNVTWTLLTEHVNAGSDSAMEWVDVKAEVREQAYRFLKLQVDEPGVASDPAFPGIWSLSEFRIDGERIEAVGSLDAVEVSSPDDVAGRVVAGDTAEVTFSGDDAISGVAVTIQGRPATLTDTGEGTWRATATLTEPTAPGYVPFAIDFVTPDGRQADTVAATTDTSRLYLSTDAGLVDAAFGAARVIAPDGSTSTALVAEAGRLFDGNAATHTDTRAVNGTYAITWDFGTGGSVALTGAEILVRQDGYGISRISNLRLEGSADGITWTRLNPAPPRGTLDWQQWIVRDQGAYRYVRLVNGTIMGVAELRLYGAVA